MIASLQCRMLILKRKPNTRFGFRGTPTTTLGVTTTGTLTPVMSNAKSATPRCTTVLTSTFLLGYDRPPNNLPDTSPHGTQHPQPPTSLERPRGSLGWEGEEMSDWVVNLWRAQAPPRIMESVWDARRAERLIWLGGSVESVCWECPLGSWRRGVQGTPSKLTE